MTAKTPDWFHKFKDRITWDEFNQNFHINLVKKYLYVETPKVACSTIKARLYEQVTRGLTVPKEIHPTLYCSPFVRPFQLPDDHIERVLYSDEYFRFSFVREPIERVLSAYLDKIKRPMPQRERFLKRFLPEKEPTYEPSFDEFVSALQSVKSCRNFDKHWRPQHDLMLLPEIKYHFTGCLSRFEEDWEKLFTIVGVKNPSGKKGNILWHATSAGEKIDTYVTDDILAKLNKLYENDVLLYSKTLTEN